MTLIVYCTSEELRYVLSSYGVALRADDRDQQSSTTILTDSIAKGTTDVNFYLFQRYSPAVIQASSWATWCTAHFAAVALCRRRGNPVPESLQQECNRYLEQLKLIMSGQAQLVADDGLARPEADNSPGVSNMRIDSRYVAAVRRVPQTSTAATQSPHRKGFPLRGTPYPLF